MADEAEAEATEGTEEEAEEATEEGTEEGAEEEAAEAPQGEDEQVVKETSYSGSAGARGTIGSAGEGSLVSNIPLTDDEILEQLKNLDAEAKKRAAKIQLMRESIDRYQKADVLSDEVAQKLEQKQKELIADVQEFDRITVEIQRLIGIAEASGLSLPSVECFPAMKKGPAAKEIGYVASGLPGNIAAYLTDRTPKIITATFRDGVPQVIMLDSPRKGGACQPLTMEGLDALARKNKKSRSQRTTNRSRSTAAAAASATPVKFPVSSRPPAPGDLGNMLREKFQCLQAEIDELKDENGKLNKLIVHLVQDSVPEKCYLPTCTPDPGHLPPCISLTNVTSSSTQLSCWELPPRKIPSCKIPPCQEPPPIAPCRRAPCPKPPRPKPPCLKPPCREAPCVSPRPFYQPPPPPPPACQQPPCLRPPCPPRTRPPSPSKSPSCPLPPTCPLPPCAPSSCVTTSCPSEPCTTTSTNMCPAYLANQIDKLDEELQELQQMLACERMEVELDRLKQLKDSCKAVPCSLLPRCPPKPRKC